MKIRREGFPFIFGSGLLSLVLARLGLGIVGLIPVIFVTWFFRDRSGKCLQEKVWSSLLPTERSSMW